MRVFKSVNVLRRTASDLGNGLPSSVYRTDTLPRTPLPSCDQQLFIGSQDIPPAVLFVHTGSPVP